MANLGYGITATQINKVMGGNEWDDQTRMQCYKLAAIAELPDDTAKAEFVAMLNTLGIVPVKTESFGKNVTIETFSYNGVMVSELSDNEKKEQIVEKLFANLPKDIAMQQLQIEGDVLNVLYQNVCGKSRNTAPFVIYRISVGENIIYRITQDTDTSAISGNAVRYVGQRNTQA